MDGIAAELFVAGLLVLASVLPFLLIALHDYLSKNSKPKVELKTEVIKIKEEGVKYVSGLKQRINSILNELEFSDKTVLTIWIERGRQYSINIVFEGEHYVSSDGSYWYVVETGECLSASDRRDKELINAYKAWSFKQDMKNDLSY